MPAISSIFTSPAQRFKWLVDEVSIQIAMGYSDHEIAEELGTSVEFVARQRKFLSPRPPILPEQLKRGIFYRWGMLGKKHSPETRAKMTAARRGKKHSAETKAKIAASHRGKKHSPETRAKMAASHRGKKHSPETKAKMSKTRKKQED